MIAYASRTGNVRHIVSKLGLPSVEINQDMLMNEDYIIFTYTDKLGEIPKVVSEFLLKNQERCKGVIVSGNTNFGHSVFGQAGDKIAEQYGVPLLRKIDLRGTPADYNIIKERYSEVLEQWKSI